MIGCVCLRDYGVAWHGISGVSFSSIFWGVWDGVVG